MTTDSQEAHTHSRFEATFRCHSARHNDGTVLIRPSQSFSAPSLTYQLHSFLGATGQAPPRRLGKCHFASDTVVERFESLDTLRNRAGATLPLAAATRLRLGSALPRCTSQRSQICEGDNRQDTLAGLVPRGEFGRRHSVSKRFGTDRRDQATSYFTPIQFHTGTGCQG